MSQLVLGLGNPVLTDDAVGLTVAAAVQRLLNERRIPGVQVRTSSRGGLDLLDLLTGCARVIIVDCLAVPHPQPGAIRRLKLDRVAGSARLVNAHDVGLGDVFRLALQLGIPMPREVEIFAVEGGDTTTLSETMTPEVAAAVEPLALQILNNIQSQVSGGTP